MTRSPSVRYCHILTFSENRLLVPAFSSTADGQRGTPRRPSADGVTHLPSPLPYVFHLQGIAPKLLTHSEAGLVGSMGSVGDAYDNAMAESFFATLKTELLDRQRWMTRMQLRAAIFDYIEVFYNRRRRHSALGHLSPIEFERRWLTTGRRSGQPPAA